MALAGRACAVFGFASHRSLAWGVADAWQRAGASVIFALQTERFRPALEKLTADWPSKPRVVICDATSDAQLSSACEQIADASSGRLHAALHSMAYASQAAMRGRFSDTSREDFRQALDISAYSLIGLSRGLAPIMRRSSPLPGAESSGSSAPNRPSAASRDTSSIITLSYLGAQRVVPGYRVMGVAKAALEASVRYLAEDLGREGVRVNAISAGPIDTLAARGIPGFTAMRDEAAQRAPLGRGISLADVGGMATFLASDAASAVTGQVLYVDSGVSIL